jgi:exosome complex protein LRP1
MEPLEKCKELLGNLNQVLIELNPILDDKIESILSKLDVIESAELLCLLSFAIDTLAFIYLKSNGINPKTHIVKQELDRCKRYFQKIGTFRVNEPEKKLQLDKEAANRFVTANLLKSSKKKGKSKVTKKRESN